MQLVKPAPYYEAIDKIGGKTPIGSAMMSAEWQDVPVALRERAMFSSRVENIRFLQRGRDSITDFLSGALEDTPGGPALATGGRAQFIEQMRAFALAEGMGPLDGVEPGGLRDITSERRLGLIFDVQTRQGDDYGYWRQGMQSDVLNEFPAQRFIRVQQVKQERESHIPFENQVYLKTDPIWAKVINADFGVPWGPWGWGCGHDVEDVDRGEAQSLGLLSAGDVVEPDVKNFNENLRASTNGLDPDLLEKLKGEFGDKLIIEGDEMKWRASATAPNTSPVAAKPALPAKAVETEDVSAAALRDSRGPRSPVSKAIEVKASGMLREAVKAALAAIDRVHDDGTLPTIPVGSTRKSCLGLLQLRREGMNGLLRPELIGVKATGPWPQLTTAHEVGHLLDVSGLSQTGQFVGRFATTSGNVEMLKVLAAAEQTEAIASLRKQLAATKSSAVRGHLSYLLSPKEIWARAYAQFIAERGGSAAMSGELASALEKSQFKIQWETADFKAVGEAIEKMFGKLGWM